MIQFEAQGPTWTFRIPIDSGGELTLECHSDAINLVILTHDSTLLVSASDDEFVIVENARSGQCLLNLEDRGSEAVYSATFSSDSKRLASASSSHISGNHSINVWDASSGQCLSRLWEHGGGLNQSPFHMTLYASPQIARWTIKV
ncbi:hypothetical protein N7513_010774 [Penicillium frequentans]|nr:hypothetical protein N7513_010774 [Penicillium glabrum]